MRRRILSFLLLGAMLFPAGCLNARSLDIFGYVLAIGFDKGDTMPLHVTLVLQNTQLESDSQKNSGMLLAEADCRNLYEAMDTLSGSLPYQLDFSRTSLIVLGKTLVAEASGLDALMDITFSQLRIRYNVNLFVALDSAAEVLEGLKNEIDPNLSKIQINYKAYSEGYGLIPVTNLTGLLEATSGKTNDILLPLCGVPPEKGQQQLSKDSVGPSAYAYFGGKLLVKSEMKTELSGSAIFSGTRMTGYLDGQHTMLVLMCTGDFHAGRVQLLDASGREVVLDLRRDGAPRIKVRFESVPKATVYVPLEGELELPERYDRTKEEISALAKTYLETETAKVFACCQSLGADAFGLGRSAVKNFRTQAAWDAFPWKSVYQAMEVTFLYQVRLENQSQKSALE